MSVVCKPDSEVRENLRRAVSEWSDLLGAERVLHDRQTINGYSRTCIPHSTQPLAVIRPKSAESVSGLVRIAATHRIPLYPISCGKNWGYGTACPTTQGQVVLDLSQLNRIIEVNTELAYAVIEPGVTQGQLYEHLRDHGDSLMLDVTGAGPDASIVGNALERGFGHSPYGDHFGHTCGMEVFLADGRVLNTGFGSYQNSQAARVFPWGIGPWLDGLFSQSNFGIVTKLGIWLMPRPPVCQAFAFTVPRSDQIGDIVTELRKLRISDVVRSNVHIANDLRLLSARMRYPWHLTDDATPLPDSIRQSLRKKAALGAWNVMGGLYGTRETVAAARQVIRKAFRGLSAVRFFDARKLQRMNKVANVLGRIGLGRNLRETLASASNVYDLLQGIPSPDHLNGVAWRSKKQNLKAPINPTDFGGMWLSPVLPMTTEACREVLELVKPIFSRYSFEPLISFSTLNARALCCVLGISFDKSDTAEQRNANRCYEELFDVLFQRGYISYRAGIQSMQKLDTDSSVFWDVCQQLKETLDPDNVISPGRYQPRWEKAKSYVS